MAYFKRVTRRSARHQRGRLTKNVTQAILDAEGEALPALPLHSSDSRVHVSVSMVKMVLFDPTVTPCPLNQTNGASMGEWFRDGRSYYAIPLATEEIPGAASLEHSLGQGQWQALDTIERVTSKVNQNLPPRGFLRVKLDSKDTEWKPDYGLLCTITQRPG